MDDDPAVVVRAATAHGWMRRPEFDRPGAWAWELPDGQMRMEPAETTPKLVTMAPHQPPRPLVKHHTHPVMEAMRRAAVRYWRYDNGWECRERGSETWWQIATPDEVERLSIWELADLVRQRVEAARAV